MKTIALLLIIWFSIDTELMAQDGQYYRLKGGADPNKAIPLAEKYQFAAFVPGKLYFKNGNVSQASFNYNRLLGEMHFVGPRGDTLALANDPTIQSVTIGQDVFVYEFPATFWRVIETYGSVKLVGKQTLALIDAEKQGGYGQSTATSSIRNTTVLSNSNGSMAKLNSQSDLLLSKKVDYGLMDQNSRFLIPKQNTILSLFSQKKQAIKAYLQENSVNFKQEADLQKLLSFCSTTP